MSRPPLHPVDVVIVSYRTPDDVVRCASSALAARPTSVTVVDNASGDDTLERLADVPGVYAIDAGANLGFGAAANLGAARGSARYLLVLNADTVVVSETLEVLTRALDQHPDAAVAGPRLRRGDGSLQRSTYPFPSLADTLVGETGLHLLAGRVPVLRERLLRTWSHDRVRQVPWLVGAALLFRRRDFEAVRGFDEGFFMYSEEVDLCRRLRERDRTCLFVPDTTIVHLGEASARQQHRAMLWERQRSAVRYLRLHADPAAARRQLVAHRWIVRLRAVRDHLLAWTGRDRRARLASAREHAALAADDSLWQL